MNHLLSIKLFDNLDNEYYLADELKILAPKYFIGTSKTVRKIIEKKQIPETQYIYATTLKKNWKICDINCKKAKLLLNKNWVINNNELKTEIENCKSDNIEKSSSENKEKISKNRDYEIVPPILYLNDDEKFRDENENIMEIETRGEKVQDKIFFKVKDVSNCFNLPFLKDTLLKDERGYERNIDYKTFNRSEVNDLSTNKTTLYLTYNGLLRVLYVNKNKNTKQFRNWAEQKLFTIQFGKDEEKEELSSELLKVNVRAIRDVFKSSSSNFPCIYLFELGRVRDIRKAFNISDNINDNLMVYKYGTTKDMKSRIYKNESDYGKYENVNMKLKLFSYIDPKYNYEAEDELKNMFNGLNMKLDIDGRNEMVAFSDNHYKIIENQYIMIFNKYSGCVKKIQNKLDNLKNEYEKDLLKKDLDIEKIKNERDLYIKDIQIKNLQIEKMNIIVEQKDLIIENLKLKELLSKK
jgi:hypothetical protein